MSFKEDERHTGRRQLCDNRGRDWGDASASQRMPETPEVRTGKEWSSTIGSEGAWPC